MSKTELITGPQYSGKGTRFLRHYRQAGGTDTGLFSLKRLDGAGDISGYDLLLLPDTGTSYPLARLASEANLFAEADRLFQGRFVFSLSAFTQAAAYVQSRPSPRVWIDEIGKLELRGEGYASLLHQLLERRVDLTLTVRDHYMPTLLANYSITNYQILLGINV